LSFSCHTPFGPRVLHSFPTRRSSDLRLEFAFEFKRWYDIKRWDILEEVFATEKSLEPHTVNPTRDYLFPIPQREVDVTGFDQNRSEEHTSELQSRENLVCRLLLEKKN